jgi:hypothetical protein
MAICSIPVSRLPLNAFIQKITRRPWTIMSLDDHRVGWYRVQNAEASVRAGSLNPMRWYVMEHADLRCFAWLLGSPMQARAYLAGTGTLDSQHLDYPADTSQYDKKRYSQAIGLTDDDGPPLEWLKPYIPTTGLEPLNVVGG